MKPYGDEITSDVTPQVQNSVYNAIIDTLCIIALQQGEKTMNKASGNLVSFDDLRKAATRVGLTRKGQFEWALGLANETDASEWSAGRKLDMRIEAIVFLGGQRVLNLFSKDKARSIDSPMFPSEEKMREIRTSVASVLTTYTDQGEVNITLEGRTHVYLAGGEFAFIVADMAQSATVRVMKLLADFSDHVRRCPAGEGCGKWFLAKKTDAIFCSKTCGTRKRIRELRERKAKKGAKKHAKR